MSADAIIFQFFHGFARQSGFFDAIIFIFAKYVPYFLVAAAVWRIWLIKPRREKLTAFLFTALTLLLSRGLITELIRYFYDRPRPFQVLDFKPLFSDLNPSFPSGHAAFFFALAFVLMYFNQKVGYWLIFLSILNGLGRIAAGVHWPTDILGGIFVAALSFLLVMTLFRRLENKNANLEKISP